MHLYIGTKRNILYSLGFLLLLGWALIQQVSAQEYNKSQIRNTNKGVPFQSKITLNWVQAEYLEADDRIVKSLSFDGAAVNPGNYLPIYSTFKKSSKSRGEVIITSFVYEEEEMPVQEAQELARTELGSEYSWSGVIRSSMNEPYVYLSMVPLRREGNRVFRINSFSYSYDINDLPESRSTRGANSWKENSMLSSGDWYKFKVGEDGIYKITYAELVEYGILSQPMPSNNLRMYGTPAGMLNMENSDYKPDDLMELAIHLEDGGDGEFGPSDYLLFFGEDQDTWEFRNFKYYHHRNVYADSNVYFLTTNAGIGAAKRVNSQNQNLEANVFTSAYSFCAYHESDQVNLIKSGREWYGEKLGIIPSYDFGFSVPDVVQAEQASVQAKIAARSVGVAGTKARLAMPNQQAISVEQSFSAAPSGYAQTYAYQQNLSLEFFPSNSDFLTKIEYDNSLNPQATAWVNEIEVSARRDLKFLDPFMSFRDERIVGNGNISKFTLTSDLSSIMVWDVTYFSEIENMTLELISQNQFEFVQTADTLREFIAFNPQTTKTPTFSGGVENQNLHGHRDFDYVIVSHPLFISHAQQLADFHADEDGFNTVIVTPNQIYNEFSGGVQDVTAIKEYMRMLYKRAESENGVAPKYLLLFGDASYDYKDRISGNSNFVPAYQTGNSLVPTRSIVSDDFFGSLDDDEGDSSVDLVDIGIGRLPARSKAEATSMVQKTLAYASKASFGEWRNWVAFVSDDLEEYNPTVFMQDADELDAIIADSAERINVEKLFMDAFTQVSGSGGQRYPDGAQAISDRVEKGALMMYYIGHGGELGWAHERILEIPTINKWTNSPKLPVFITATCEFTRFDDPRRTSAGEYVMLNPDGGGVALLTTTRAVYGSPNLTLTTQFTKAAFSSISNGQQRLGDLNRLTKVRSLTVGDTATENALIANNTRCFTLLGDPALRLAYPEYDVHITSMPDTIKALDKVLIKGRVAFKDGTTIEDFNGLVIPVVFDKVSELQTQNNDDKIAYNYEERRNILFRGKVRAENGIFQFEFIVPKDIDKSFGEGKLSLYAYDDTRDAGGAYFDYVVGGLSDNPVVDNEGPEVDLFMNNDQFVFGGMTDENPDLYAEVYDLIGINMVGNGIGHDIIAVLDENSSNTLVLNDYYEADENSYQTGKIRYPFNELEEGLHKLKLQVWDVSNNPTDAYTEFVVANSEDFALSHILNYPNPFTTNTDFFFEHNKPGQSLDVSIDVFTVSGKLVKTIRGSYYSDGFRIGPINWNGTDQYGDKIAKGVYLYKMKVKTSRGQTAEQYERLVILN